MSELLDYLDYASRIVRRYRASGLERRDFAADYGIPVTTLDYYVSRTNRDVDSREAERLPNHILSVDLAVEELEREATFATPSGGVAVRRANGRVIEVARGFHRGLLRDVVSALEEHPTPGKRGAAPADAKKQWVAANCQSVATLKDPDRRHASYLFPGRNLGEAPS